MATPRPNPIAPGEAIDPHALMRIKSLQLRARAAVEGFVKGLHRSPYHGFSVEFSEYRQYTPGDDPRYLDWKLFARSDRYHIKRFEDETNLRCTLVVDTSRSMLYGSGAYTKSDYARTLAATVALFLGRQRDAVGLITFEDQITQYLPPRHRPGHLARLVALLEREPTAKVTDLGRSLDQVAATVRKRGLVILVSDLLAPVDLLKARLGYLRATGHDVVVLRVLDPAEIDFPFDAPARFRDAESGRDVYVDPANARAGYQTRFRAHANEIRRGCDDLGVELVPVRTDQALGSVLFDLLKNRMRRGRATPRRGRAGG